MKKVLTVFKNMWQLPFCPGYDALKDTFDFRVRHVEQVLHKVKTEILSMAFSLHANAAIDVILDAAIDEQFSSQALLLNLTISWQCAHPASCGQSLADLGVYVLRNGMLVKSSTTAASPSHSCHCCMLSTEANFDKPECCMPSAWTEGLQCACKAVCALHGQPLAALISLFISDSWLCMHDNNTSWWPRMPVAAA